MPIRRAANIKRNLIKHLHDHPPKGKNKPSPALKKARQQRKPKQA
ncbi:hypothetical protein LCGC14_2259770 [marine sediment metagenome]|uniref:Uncharacterized protein n=1 Tax=marine sediment metagenome TaxID=412755 RepID=A0A0F9DMF9_9ZZZZ